jgi:WD40 repeat protein
MSGLMGFEEAFQVADLAVRAVRAEGLRDIERVVLEGSWNRQTYQTIAAEAGYTEGYLSRDVGPALWSVLSDALGMQVKKTNFRTAIERWSKQHHDETLNASASPSVLNGQAPNAPSPALMDENEAPAADSLPFDIADFRGREDLLADLTEWIAHGHGRLLCLFGIPGIGKTWMAVKLAEQVRSHFHRLIYRDLSDGPTPLALATDLLECLKFEVSSELSLRSVLDRLAQALTQCKCCLVLDHTETFYRQFTLAGTYEAGFEDYSQILETFASREHQSCIIWVGRLPPKTATLMAGSSCRFEAIPGFSQTELPHLTFWPEAIEATSADWHHLSLYYGGSPTLILSEIVPRLASFGHRLGACIDALQWDNRFLPAYVDSWLAPLADIEWKLLTLMMISHRPLSLTQLSHYLAMDTPLSAVESLCDRGLCRALMGDEPQWEIALPDVLIPYLSNRFLHHVQTADESVQIHLLHCYPLVQSEAPEMVRQWQYQALLVPIARGLEEALPQLADKQDFLRRTLQLSRQLTREVPTIGYSAGNLMNLAQYWQISLVEADLQGLQLREADLQSDLFQGVSLAGADLSQTLLAKPLGQCPIIAMCPDHVQVAVGDQDGRLLLWNIQDGRLQRAMLNDTNAIRAIAFSPDGQTLAEGRQDGTVRLWDLRSEHGPELFATTIEGVLTKLIFSLDRQFLIGGDDRGYLYVWLLASGQEVYRLPAHEASIVEIALSPCYQRLITCGQDCVAIERELQTGEIIHGFQGRLTSSLGTVAYLPDPHDGEIRSVVVGRDEGQLILWDIPSARPLRVMDKAGDLFMALALSPNGQYLAASDASNTVSIWDVNSRTCLYQISESSAPVESLVFSSDSIDLMMGCDYTVQRWQVSSGQCLRVWRSDRHPAVKLALATHPLNLLSSHDDQTLRCWQFSATRQCWLPQERLRIPGEGLISAIATCVQGTYRAVGTEDGHVYVWHREQQVWLTWPMRLLAEITALQFSADGTCLAAGDAIGTVALWDLPQRIFHWQKKEAHEDRVTALAFAPDGQSLFSGSRDRSIYGWDQQGNSIAELLGHRRRVHTLQVAADGQTLYSGSYDGTIRRWHLGDNTCQEIWEKGDRYLHWITLNEQKRPVAIISDTQTLEVWDIEPDACRTTFSVREETLWHVSTSPDGAALVCASQTGEIRIWSLTSGQQQGELRVDRPYEGMQIGGSLGLTDSERQMLYSLGATDY